MSENVLTDGRGDSEGLGIGAAGAWRELVEQIELLEELIAEVRNAGDRGGEFLLAELHRLLSRRRGSLHALLDGVAGGERSPAAD